MDEIFAIFIDSIGQPIFRREVPPSTIDRYRGKLPEQLLSYWTKHGWCGYGDGLFWTVNPQDYEGVVSCWLADTPLGQRDAYHIIARNAFGDLYLFGEKTGFSLTIDSALSRYSGENNTSNENLDKVVRNFFLSIEKDSNDFDGLFDAAKCKLGTLNQDEMYGFVPALMFGGQPKLEYLEKVKIIEHLTFLSQLQPLEPYSFSDF